LNARAKRIEEAAINGRLRRLVGNIAAAITEMNEAQRRVSALRTAQDRYLLKPDEPPDTYAEFLARTSGVLLREPSARGRSRRIGTR
jgi:CheY-like chemotaxis protein